MHVVHDVFSVFLQNAFHIAVAIVDNILIKVNSQLKDFQLMGCVSAYIATKFEDVNVPTVATFLNYVEGHDLDQVSYLTFVTRL